MPEFACNIPKYELQLRHFNFVSYILGSLYSSNCWFFHFSRNEKPNIVQRCIEMDSYGMHMKWQSLEDAWCIVLCPIMHVHRKNFGQNVSPTQTIKNPYFPSNKIENQSKITKLAYNLQNSVQWIIFRILKSVARYRYRLELLLPCATLCYPDWTNLFMWTKEPDKQQSTTQCTIYVLHESIHTHEWFFLIHTNV